MRGGGNDPSDRRKARGDKIRHVMKCPAFDDDHQVVGAAHEITGFDLFEAADALSKPIESSLAFRGNLYLDQRADLSFSSGIRVKHGPPAEQNVVSFQL